MKKLLTLTAAALFAGSASAVTMAWTATGVSFSGSKLKSNSDVIGYLIAADSLGSYDLSSFSVSSIGTQVDTTSGTSSLSKLGSNWTIDTTNYDNGDTFAILLEYTKDGNTYYNLASSLVTMSNMSLDPPVNASDVTGSFDYSTATGNTLTAGGGWFLKPATPDPGPQPGVPEPATGALALAGVALLFKRRRA